MGEAIPLVYEKCSSQEYIEFLQFLDDKYPKGDKIRNEIVFFETAVYISCRLSSCKFCKKVFVLEKGEIVQLGSHDRLVVEDGIYREMWNTQVQYYM